MSVASAKDFLERMKTDADFAKQVIACPDNVSRIKFVRSAGFDFTPEELQPLRESLSDAELEGIAGGDISGGGGCVHPIFAPQMANQ